MPSKLVTIFWRDIPAQINAQSGRVREQRVLPRRFQRAIERATRKADITTADVYVRQWRRESRPCGDDLLTEALAGAAALEDAYPQERLFALAANLGWEPKEGEEPPVVDDALDDEPDQDDDTDNPDESSEDDDAAGED